MTSKYSLSNLCPMDCVTDQNRKCPCCLRHPSEPKKMISRKSALGLNMKLSPCVLILKITRDCAACPELAHCLGFGEFKSRTGLLGLPPPLLPWLFCHKCCGWESFANSTCGFSKFACCVFSAALLQTHMWFASHLFLTGAHLLFPEQRCCSFLHASLAFLQLFLFPYNISDQNVFTPALCYAFTYPHSFLPAFRGV